MEHLHRESGSRGPHDGCGRAGPAIYGAAPDRRTRASPIAGRSRRPARVDDRSRRRDGLPSKPHGCPVVRRALPRGQGIDDPRAHRGAEHQRSQSPSLSLARLTPNRYSRVVRMDRFGRSTGSTRTMGRRGGPGGGRRDDRDRWVLVGGTPLSALLEREHELTEMAKLVDRARGGEGSVVVVEGPAGSARRRYWRRRAIGRRRPESRF